MINIISLYPLVTIAMAVMTSSFTPITSTFQVYQHNHKAIQTMSPFITELGVSTSPGNNIGPPATQDDKASPLNPSSAFGQPIPPKISSFNKLAIAFVKNNFFDAFFDATAESDSRAGTLTRCYARFYALETIARMPYFSYLSVLHLYETLGLWRRADYMKVHFCESWNELHHLLIMEELGGNTRFIDRFVAQHSAFFYYWFVIACYMSNPTLAYNLNQAVEEHACETYEKFLAEYETELKSKDAPKIAIEYYKNGNMYLFDEMHTCSDGEKSEAPMIMDQDGIPRRRPKMDTLYDTFMAIRDDEAEHAKTMEFLQRQESDISICDVQ